MKGKIRLIIAASALCTFFAFAAKDVHAGTCVYVGKDVSSDGTTLLGASTEYDVGNATVPEIIEKASIRKGDVIECVNGYKYTMPEDNAKVLLVRMMDYVGIGRWGSCASNEYGVSIVSTISVDTKPEAVAADPFEEKGICEEKIALILASTSKTAEDAVRTLCSIYEETGADTAEIVMIADRKEAWVVENFTGHQYAALRLPDDKMAVFAHNPIIRTIDPDDKDAITSSDLLVLPEKNGFAVYDDDKNIDLIHTYLYESVWTEENCLKEWLGHDIFAPSEKLEYDQKGDFDIFFTPDEKVDIEQVFDVFRNRYEGTDYAIDGNDETIFLGINNQYVSNANVIQIFPDAPETLSTVLWTTPGNPTAAPFIPIPVAAENIPESFAGDAKEDEFTEGTLQFDFAKLNNSVYPRRKAYGTSIKQYWEGAESLLAADLRDKISTWSNEADVSEEIDGFVADNVERTDENCIRLRDELDLYLFRNGTLSPQKISDDELEPFECSFDAVSYARANGWETTVESDVFTATKDGKKIEVILAGENKGAVTFTGFDNEQLMKDFMAEDTDETEAAEEPEEAEVTEEIEVTEEPAESEEIEETKEPETEAEEPAEVKPTETEPSEEKTKTEEAEEVSEAPSQEVLDVETEVADKVQVDTIAALEDYFAEKIANIPRDGWAENEIASQIGDISLDVAGIVIKHFDVEINSLEDAERFLNNDLPQIANDPELAEIGDKLAVTGMDITALLEKYFTALVDDANADVMSGRISQEGVEKILLEAESDIEGIAQLYVQGVFGQIFDTQLSDEEFSDALAELGAGALQLMDEYGAIDLDALGLGDIDVDALTDADIEVIITLNELDDDVIDGLSQLIGVDVRSVIDSYMKALDGTKLEIEDHDIPSAWSAPDEEIMAAIEKEEELTEDDVVLSQDVIDTINEAIIGGYFEEALDAIEGEETSQSIAADTEDGAETEAETEAEDSDAYTIQLQSVKASDSKVMLPVYMLKYFK